MVTADAEVEISTYKRCPPKFGPQCQGQEGEVGEQEAHRVPA